MSWDQQAKKYASDLNRLYNKEKEERKKLELAYQQLREFAKSLKVSIKETKKARTDLENSYLETINCLVAAAEYKDEDTGDHIARISLYSRLMAERLELSEELVQQITFASPMHDIGKIGIPESILLKPAKLTAAEFETMKTHTVIGARILARSSSPHMRVGGEIALSHHEKWNGKGYPHGLKGDTIPLSGRILAIVDVFDALTSKRPYKSPYPTEVAVDIIIKEREEHFDPELVDLFVDNLEQVEKIKNESGMQEPASFALSERDLERQQQ